ncbi:Fc.00g010390.m01.CDS01 [Cosmosporella sp. VM-42]
MRPNNAYAATVVYLASVASATLDKPVIQPPFPDGGLQSLDQGLDGSLATVKNTWAVWEPGWIPQDCKNLIQSTQYSAADVITLQIQYDDCKDPWVFCRHKDSPLSEQQIVDTWGRLPVHFRSFVRHMLFLPGTASAGSAGDNVQMNGNLGISVYTHETAHSMDGHGFPDIGGFSVSQIWLDAYNADSAVPDDYSRSSQQENFAQQIVVALYDKVVPGGIGNVQPNFQAIFNQYHTILEHADQLLSAGGECTSRLQNSAPVQIDGTFKMTSAKPDVSLSPDTKVLKSIPMGDTIVIYEYDTNGKVSGKKTVKIGL